MNKETRTWLTGVLLFSVLSLFSCNSPEGERIRGKGFNYITIDSCEYIEADYGILEQRVYSLTHKGNCKNHKTK